MVTASIILLNYNGKKFNIPCIDSILSQSYQDFEIVFVDNASSDGSLEEVQSHYKNEIQDKKIVIVASKKNTGFAGGNNLGTTYVHKTSQYICLLNNDTTVSINRLQELISGIQSDQTIGAVGSLVLDRGYEDKIKKVYFQNHEVFVLNILGETAKKKVSGEEVHQGIYYTTSISGCAFLYKRAIIEKPFPDFYFAYGEDVFLSLLLIKKGYKLGICTKSIVQHEGSGSFGKKPSPSKLFYGNRNQIINFLVFYGFWTKIKLLSLFFITQLAHICINVPGRRLIAKIQSWIWIIKHRSDIKTTRKRIYKEVILDDKTFIKKLSYKFSDDLYRMGGGIGKGKKKIIHTANILFKNYIKLFFK